MKYSAGMDVSLEETSICIVDETGTIVKEMGAASDLEVLAGALPAAGLPLERVGLEACSLKAWLHGGLPAAGWAALCIEMRHANAAMKTRPNSEAGQETIQWIVSPPNDRHDARALAQIMRTGWFRQVHVKSRQSRFWRLLLVARRTALGEMRSIEAAKRTWCARHSAKHA